MKPVSAFLLSLLLGTTALAQTPAQPAARAAIEGIVTREPDSQPIKKVLIELIAENQAEGGDYTAVTGPDGAFRIENIVPGRYHLFAEHTGLLDTDKEQGRTDGRMLTLTPGQEVKDLHLRLQAAAVVRGRVTDEDGDPLPNAEVAVLRHTFVAGHSRWEQAGAERTNDLGEYRIANLPAGTFYVSVSPPPDFKTLIEAAGATGGNGRDSNAGKSSTSYQTTYYPGTSDRTQAAPLQLRPGDDFPANFSLVPSPSLTIKGWVINLPPRTSASVMLQSHDFNVVISGAEMHKDGSFIIRDVSPGNYTIMASVDGSPVPMTARQSVQVGSTSVEGLRLSPQPGATIRGRLRMESRAVSSRLDMDRTFLALQSVESDKGEDELPLGERFSNLAHVAEDGSFVWTDVPAGNYYVQLMGESEANEGWFVKSALAGGRDLNDSGMSINGGTVVLDLVASSNGGTIEGVSVDQKGSPVANAVVVAAPDVRLRGRPDHFRKTVSDQAGHFTLRGIRAGDYTVFAWESVDGEAYFNPDFLKIYEGRGTTQHLAEGERKTLRVEAIPENQEQP